MIRLIFIGLWVCLVTVLSIYGTAYWAAGSTDGKGDVTFASGPEYRRLPNLNVPMIIDGSVKGYVIAKLIYTADAGQLQRLGIDPTTFVTSVAFNEFYMNGRVDTGKLSKYNFKEMLDNIKKASNEKLNGEVVQDVLIDSINYIDKNDMRKMADMTAPPPPEKPEKAEKPGKATH